MRLATLHNYLKPLTKKVSTSRVELETMLGKGAHKVWSFTKLSWDFLGFITANKTMILKTFIGF